MAAAKITLIDDDKDWLALLEKRLEYQGYRANGFTDSSEAVKHIRHETPDLVISDIQMPKLNGFEVYDLIKGDPRTRNIPFIMMTGVKKARDQMKSMAGSEVYYVFKQDGAEGLAKAIKSALARNRFCDDSLLDQ